MTESIYDSIGGRGRVQAAVDLFYVKVLADPDLEGFFSGVDEESLRGRQGMFVCMLLGGKVIYTGKDIRAAHSGARIRGMNDAHFDKVLKHFKSSLQDIDVHPDNILKIMAQLNGMRETILGRAPEL